MDRAFSGRKLFWTGALLSVCALVVVTQAHSGLVTVFTSPPALELATPRAASVVVPLAPPAPQATYALRAGLQGEIFPVFANHASLQRAQERQWSTLSVRITNTGKTPLHQRIAVELPGWSDEEVQTVGIGPGESRVLLFAPTFLPRLYANQSLIAATARMTATDATSKTVYTTTVPVRLRPAEDMHWGSGFRYAPFIASWVTPHDPQVERVLSRAKEFMPGRRLPGYEPWKTAPQQEQSTRAQVRAIYRALQQSGISYVKSSTTFGAHVMSQRVRLPGASLGQASANCIDGVVMYASLFENLGMDPVIALVPGHAYVGVRLSPKSDRYLWLDTVLTGRGSFEAAVSTAEKGMQRYQAGQVRRIEVAGARKTGIFPLPLPQPGIEPLDASAGEDAARRPVRLPAAAAAVAGEASAQPGPATPLR